jgi:hypothetical protein
VDIFKVEKTGSFREFTEKAFSSLQQGALPLRCSLEGCKPEKYHNSREKQNPGNIDLQCPGESKWRDSASRRNEYSRDSPLGRSLLIR